MNAETMRQLLELVRSKGVPLTLDPSCRQPIIQPGNMIFAVYSIREYNKKHRESRIIYRVLDVTKKRDWQYSIEQYREGRSLSFELFQIFAGCLDPDIVRKGKRLRPALLCRYQIPLFNRYVAAIVSDKLAVNVSEPEQYDRHYMVYVVPRTKPLYEKFELFELNLEELLKAAPVKQNQAVA
jgi:hypothetical protein